MSRRITHKSMITDRTLAVQALKDGKYTYREDNGTITVTSGKLANVMIDLKTGLMTGDSDYGGHTTRAFKELNVLYSVAESKAAIFKEGHTIISTTTEKNGNVVLLCRQA